MALVVTFEPDRRVRSPAVFFQCCNFYVKLKLWQCKHRKVEYFATAFADISLISYGNFISP